MLQQKTNNWQSFALEVQTDEGKNEEEKNPLS